MIKNLFCAAFALGFLLGMFITDCWWLDQWGGFGAGPSQVREPASACEARPVTSL
ncbi:MAG: hypothetical protein Q8R10_12380 [Pseudomonas sp.]|uniref:hypothetical protein n=1 Tax=Pseudomonas sp. TaxID=306 RepID=UPI0027331E7F|nr:hypothetical protein [Pseudomonas sp.]MDP3847208.1 hypothetical protein [Pseudomonas sp.]